MVGVQYNSLSATKKKKKMKDNPYITPLRISKDLLLLARNNGDVLRMTLIDSNSYTIDQETAKGAISSVWRCSGRV